MEGKQPGNCVNNSIIMDRHPRTFQDPGSGYQHYHRKREHSGFAERSHHQNKHFQPNSHRQDPYGTGPSRATSSNPPTLSTRKELYEKDFPLYKQPIERWIQRPLREAR
ncbi:hypothetical protein WMY93_003673 [Mugilogobius chulae]|uniref:Uncharacterized protein n=1 Tax=Mugilogobius chulae TaxID=88201 RepID=A0AAW0Q811_9GOBI